jgi:hypothetical protein
VTTEPHNTEESSQERADALVGLVDSERRTRKVHVVVPARLIRQRRAKWSLAIAASILIALQVVGFGVPFVESYFEARPPEAVARQEAQTMLNSLVDEIERFRQDYDELPESLVEIGVPPHGKWTYAVRGTKDYSLRGRVYGQPVTFDS